MLSTLDGAIEAFQQVLARHPERDGLAAEDAALRGLPRPYPGFYLNHLHDPTDTTSAPTEYAPPAGEFGDDPEGQLAREILGLLEPLDMLNPVHAVLSAGGPRSPADLVPCFGTPLSADGGAAGRTRSLDDLLRDPPPDPDAAGLMPVFREHIRFVKDRTPPIFRIGLPNMQGPFNLVHALAGDEAFTAPLEEPEKYDRFMARLTDFWIAARERFVAWIGPERLRPIDRLAYLAECSVNLVSEDFYRRYILPYDLRIARHFDGVHVHPCSGRHVFRVTLANLPGVRLTEAGQMISKMAAPCVGVEEALELIGARPIALMIGQELPADFDDAFDLVRRDVERHPANPRLLFGYTGMYWRKKDRPAIRDLHRRVDRLWQAGV